MAKKQKNMRGSGPSFSRSMKLRQKSKSGSGGARERALDPRAVARALLGFEEGYCFGEIEAAFAVSISQAGMPSIPAARVYRAALNGGLVIRKGDAAVYRVPQARNLLGALYRLEEEGFVGRKADDSSRIAFGRLREALRSKWEEQRA